MPFGCLHLLTWNLIKNVDVGKTVRSLMYVLFERVSLRRGKRKLIQFLIFLIFQINVAQAITQAWSTTYQELLTIRYVFKHFIRANANA